MYCLCVSVCLLKLNEKKHRKNNSNERTNERTKIIEFNLRFVQFPFWSSHNIHSFVYSDLVNEIVVQSIHPSIHLILSIKSSYLVSLTLLLLSRKFIYIQTSHHISLSRSTYYLYSFSINFFSFSE